MRQVDVPSDLKWAADIMLNLKNDPPRGLTFPIASPPRPQRPRSRASRSRHRHAKKMMLWVLTSNFVVGLNTLYNKNKPHGRVVSSLLECSPAEQSILTRVMTQCQELCRGRRTLGLTGAHAAKSLVKSISAGSYNVTGPSISQVSFISE